MPDEIELTEAVVDHIIENVPLKLAERIEWQPHGLALTARVAVLATGVSASLVMDLSVSTTLPGKYTFQLRQNGSGNTILRRLDVRGSHTNRPETGNTESWRFRTHKHMHRDVFADGYAYTPVDLPDTSSPVLFPEPEEHTTVFLAFCGECGLEEGGCWRPPPLGPGPAGPLLAE